MADNVSPVTATSSPAVAPATGGETSVPAGTTQTGAGDAATVNVADLQARLEQLENDRRHQQSIYDRKIADEQARNRELMQQIEQTRTQGMSEAERTKYELEQYKLKVQQYESEREAQKQIDEYAKTFTDAFKIDPAKLDRSSPEAVTTSAWQLIIDKIADLESRTAQTAPQTPQTPTQTVLTGSSGGTPRTKPTFVEMKKAVAEIKGKQFITDDEYYSYMERHPELMNQWLQK